MALCVFGIVGCGDEYDAEIKKDNEIRQKGRKALEKLCDEGVATACLWFAKDNQEEQKALEYYEKGCNGKPAGKNTDDIGESCLAIAKIYAGRLEGDKALSYYVKACERGGECGYRGKDDNRLAQLDLSAFLQAHSKACTALNNPDVCWIGAESWNREAIIKSCENGGSEACKVLSSYTDEQAQSLEYVKRACELDAEKCYSIMNELGHYGGRATAIALLAIVEQYCKNGLIDSCQKILDYYDKYGSETEMDAENLKNIATTQLDALCQTKKPECMSWYKKQIEIDGSEGRLAQLCEKGYGESCSLLGDIYAEKLDGKQAIAYYKQGCEKGYSQACDRLWSRVEDKEKRNKEVIPLFKKLCENGNSGSLVCRRSGIYDEDDIKQSIFLDIKFAVRIDQLYHNYVSSKDEREAYWLGYYKGDYKKAKKAVIETKRAKNEAKNEFLKYLPGLCQKGEKDACFILWTMHNE